MPNRITTKSEAFGLVAWLNATRVRLPLKGVECRFNVCGELLTVELDQIYHQNNRAPLDCIYTFPLPASATVYQCEMHVNGRCIRARVETQAEARQIVQEKKSAGFRTALVEVERDNLFTLSLGNVQPQDVIIVRLAYFQTLTRLKDWTSFSIPFCPGVRYIPGQPLLRSNSGRGSADDTGQVPDASRISPPRIDMLHPDAAYLHVEGTIENPADNLVDVSSPSHPLVVRDLPNGFAVSLADRRAVPDCDLAIRWTDKAHDRLQNAGWLTRNQRESYALVRLQAPRQAAVNDDYEQDVYFLIDRSGSMQGLKWTKACQAFLEFLRILGKKDRVWATLFESHHQDFAEKPLPAETLLQDKTLKSLEKMGVGGGTELLPALRHVMEKITNFSSNRPATLLLITDGQVGNEETILEELLALPKLRVHTFGIDTAVNDAFLQKAAARHHGSCHLLTPEDDIPGAVSRLADRLRRPVLTSLRIQGNWELPTDDLPDLYAGDVVCLPLRSQAGSNVVSISGFVPGQQSQEFTFQLIEAQIPALPRLWAKQRIEHLLSQEEDEAAFVLAKHHNIVCRGTAFVAWDETEKVAVAEPERVLYQPSMESRFVGGACLASPALDEETVFYRKASRKMQRFSEAAPARDSREPRKRAMSKLFSAGFLGSWKPGYSWQKQMRKELVESLGKNMKQHPTSAEWAERTDWLSSWCEWMFEAKTLQNPAGWKLLKVLCLWAVAAPTQWQERQSKLLNLQINLVRGRMDLPELREWLKTNLDGQMKNDAWQHSMHLPKVEFAP